MMDSRPSVQSGEQVFVSCHRYDPFRRFIVRFLIPCVGILVMVVILTLIVIFNVTMKSQIPPEFWGALMGVVAGAGLMGVSLALGLLALGWYLRRKFYGTSLQCDDQGLLYRSGGNEINASWDSVKIGRVLELGRMQSAVLETPQGKIRIDPSYVDEAGPHPKVRVSFGKEFLVYPDGTRIPSKIRENELFRLIEERTGAASRQ